MSWKWINNPRALFIGMPTPQGIVWYADAANELFSHTYKKHTLMNTDQQGSQSLQSNMPMSEATPRTPREIIRGDDPVPNQVYPRSIAIETVNRGYVVRVGCQTFAIENTSTLISKIAAYLDNPADVEKKWLEKREL